MRDRTRVPDRPPVDNRKPLLSAILAGYRLSPLGPHGVAHWARVLENGLMLAETSGADREVVSLFALFHDARRVNEDDDPGHGRRGAELARSLRGTHVDLDDARFELLYMACESHTEGRNAGSVTIGTCWDADRLDLGRVGITPEPAYLSTAAARSAEVIRAATLRATSGYVPPVVAAWGVRVETRTSWRDAGRPRGT